MNEVRVENQNVTRAARDLHGLGLVIEIEFWLIWSAAMAARNETSCAIFRTEIIKVSNGDDRISGSLSGHVAVQFLMTATQQRFASLDLRKKKPLTDQRARCFKHSWQATHGLHSRN